MSESADKHDCHTEPMIEFEFRNVPGIYFSHTYNVESTFKKMYEVQTSFNVRVIMRTMFSDFFCFCTTGEMSPVRITWIVLVSTTTTAV